MVLMIEFLKTEKLQNFDTSNNIPLNVKYN